MVEKVVEVGILFDFYGKLLSKKQYIAIELYYIHDLSLAEIGDELGISRQGVFDMLKRAEENLYEYEKVLGLVSKFNYTRKEIDKIYRLAEDIEIEFKDINDKRILDKVKELKDIVGKIIDNS